MRGIVKWVVQHNEGMRLDCLYFERIGYGRYSHSVRLSTRYDHGVILGV